VKHEKQIIVNLGAQAASPTVVASAAAAAVAAEAAATLLHTIHVKFIRGMIAAPVY
jgi:hypothetical protein